MNRERWSLQNYDVDVPFVYWALQALAFIALLVALFILEAKA